MPATIEAALVVMLFVVPGFIAARLIRPPVPSISLSDGQTFVVALVFSCLIHLLLAPMTFEAVGPGRMLVSRFTSGQASFTDSWPFIIWIACLLLLLPVLVAVVISMIWRAKWAQGWLKVFGWATADRMPQAWDWFFLTQKRGCWVVAEYKDGRLIGGEYGENSFAALSPSRNDLFVEREYDVLADHSFGDAKQNSIGVWINGSELRALHLYRVEQEAGHG